MNKKHHITLREGLAQFYSQYESQLSHQEEGLPSEVRSFFKSHDIAHVLFGCDISLYGEGSVKIWTIFGTSLGFWNHIRVYRKANAFELSKNFEKAQAIRSFFKLLFLIPVLMIRAKRMTKPWPFENFEPYLDTPIFEIRKEFNIQVLP